MNTFLRLVIVLWGITGLLAAQKKPAELLSLRILPGTLRLEDSLDAQGFVVLARYADQSTKDVSREAKIRASGTGKVEILSRGAVAPKRDGRVVLTASFGGVEARATIEIEGCDRPRPPSFHRDVIPILTRQGCNSGGCHGSAAGKNGFRLSLFGFDPALDHERLTREMRGRRLDLADPVRSLILQKPTMGTGHKGGKVLDAKSWEYRRLLQWVKEGAVLDDPSPRLKSVEVFPAQAVLGIGETQRVIVLAHYADGSDRDVTRLARFNTGDPTIAAWDPHGEVAAKGAGEAVIMVRFGTFAEVSRILVVDRSAPFVWPKIDERGEIDRLIDDKLRKLRIAPAGSCSDEVFVRRVYLDVLNLLPTAEESSRFFRDEGPDKRARLIDELLQRPELVDTWTMAWAEILRVSDERLEQKGMELITRALRRGFDGERPFNELIAELLVAEGGAFSEAGANLYLSSRDPKEIAEGMAQVFLGVRIQCAQCHNHPFERWTMDDYYGFTAFFSQVNAKRGEDPREFIVYDRQRGEARHPVGGAVVAPRFLGGARPEIPRGEDRRLPLARWMTSADNPWFARNVANRVWAHFFGRGLVDPVDDVRTTNPPSHPELYDYLAKTLVASGFEIRDLIRLICNSQSYQRALRSPAAPAALFAGAAVRRLSAEQLLDAVCQVTGVPTLHRGLPRGAHAVEIVGARAGDFLSIFGRPPRSTASACERRSEPTLSQALHLINGATLEAKIRDPKGTLGSLLSAKATDDQILDALWLSAYSRRPFESEAKRVKARIAGAKSRRKAFGDVLWAVLNSSEFLFNH